MKMTIPEVLEAASKTTNYDERIAILKRNETFGLRTMLQALFHPGIVFNLPEGAPPYRADVAPIGHSPSNLDRQSRKMRYLAHGPEMAKGAMKREEIFVAILESVHSTEAEFLIQVKEKNCIYPGIDQKVVWDAFPGIVPEPTEEKKKTTKRKAADSSNGQEKTTAGN
tara:strand:- start:236 stop:739 length:504 start_codon:yes stop_codon:yes gene_type:complete